MAPYARGKKALGICDKTGFQYPLSELVYETNNGRRTGLRVGRDVADADHPQNFIGRLRISDPQSLKDPRPEQSLPQQRGLFGWRPIGHPLVSMNATVGTLTVTAGE